jgi:hypothetical protein
MNSQNTICAIFGIAVPIHKGNRGRLLPTAGGGTFGGHIVPIRQGVLVRELFDPVGVLRR